MSTSTRTLRSALTAAGLAAVLSTAISAPAHAMPGRFADAGVGPAAARTGTVTVTTSAASGTTVSGWVSTGTSGAVGYTIKDAVSVKTGAGYVARTVSVQRRASTSSTWSTVSTGGTSSVGAFTASYTVPATGVWYFRLSVKATSTAASATTAARKVTGITGAATAVSGWATTAATGAVGYVVKDAVSVKTGAGYVARPVTVQRRPSTSSTWSTVASGTTSSTGAYTASYAVPGTGTWFFRLVVPATATAASRVTSPRTVTGITGAMTAVSGWVTTTATTAAGVLISDAVSVRTGTGYVARPVSVQRRASTATTWTTVATGTTSTSGAYTASYAAPAAGVWFFRLSVPATTSAAAATTAARQVTGAPAPTVTGVSPSSGPISGGTLVTVTGTNLTGASGVTFGSTAGTGLVVTSATQLQVTTAASTTAGPVPVRVTTPGGTSAITPVGTYGYTAPAPDTTPPAPVTEVISGVDGSSVTLSWTNPTDTDFTGVTIRRVPGTTPPASPTAGTLVTETPASTTSFIDDGLTADTEYSYALFAHDAVPNHAAATTTTVTTGPPPDDIAPTPVSALEATSITTSSIALSWTNPAEPDLVRVLVRRATGSTPPSLLTGVQVGSVDAPTTAIVDEGLRPGSTYTYAAFAQDASGNTSEPTTLTVATEAAPQPWVVLSAGSSYLCGIRADRSAWCSGSNESGQLGHGGDETHSPGFVRVAGAGAWVTVDAGDDHACGVKVDGTAWCWGSNGWGQLGNGTTSTEPQPVPMQVGTSTDWVSVSAGRAYSCGVMSDGAAWCWGGAGGNASLGMLGDGSGASVLVPTRVAGTAQWSEVWTGWFHTCGRTTDGLARCWGYNVMGQTGSGDREPQLVPVAVTGSASWQTLTLGAYHTCGIRANGSAWCWGYNSGRQLGDGTQEDRPSPVAVAAARSWISLAAGSSHTCGVGGDGTLSCWGDNGQGQLGTNHAPWSSFPTQVGNATTWVSVVAGYDSNLALREDASAWRWGATFWATQSGSVHLPEQF